MTAGIGDRERLLLYWVSSYTAEGISPLRVPDIGSYDAPYRHRLERDCVLAGENFPPDGALEAAQALLDGGYLTAWTYDTRDGKRRDLTDVLRLSVDLGGGRIRSYRGWGP